MGWITVVILLAIAAWWAGTGWQQYRSSQFRMHDVDAQDANIDTFAEPPQGWE